MVLLRLPGAYGACQRRRWRSRCARIMRLAVCLAVIPAGALAGKNGWRPVSPDQRLDLETAVVVGHENGMPLYACRGLIGGQTHIGRLRSDFGGCHIGYSGREIEVNAFDVLSFSWQQAAEWDVPTGSIVAGTEIVPSTLAAFASRTLYPCRSRYQGGVHLGEVASRTRGCVFGYGGERVVGQNYDVLGQESWLTWVAGRAGELPHGAVTGGGESGEPFMVCRAAERNGLRPGKIKASSSGCSIVSAARETVAERFEILTPRWMAPTDGKVPVAGVPSGSENATLQFVCRAKDGDSVQVGKTGEGLKGCHVGMGGREAIFEGYEVLAQ